MFKKQFGFDAAVFDMSQLTEEIHKLWSYTSLGSYPDSVTYSLDSLRQATKLSNMCNTRATILNSWAALKEKWGQVVEK